MISQLVLLVSFFSIICVLLCSRANAASNLLEFHNVARFVKWFRFPFVMIDFYCTNFNCCFGLYIYDIFSQAVESIGFSCGCVCVWVLVGFARNINAGMRETKINMNKYWWFWSKPLLGHCHTKLNEINEATQTKESYKMQREKCIHENCVHLNRTHCISRVELCVCVYV